MSIIIAVIIWCPQAILPIATLNLFVLCAQCHGSLYMYVSYVLVLFLFVFTSSMLVIYFLSPWSHLNYVHIAYSLAREFLLDFFIFIFIFFSVILISHRIGWIWLERKICCFMWKSVDKFIYFFLFGGLKHSNNTTHSFCIIYIPFPCMCSIYIWSALITVSIKLKTILLAVHLNLWFISAFFPANYFYHTHTLSKEKE